MRLRLGGVSLEAETYAAWTLQMGNGLLPQERGGIKLLPCLCIEGDVSQLISWTFPNLAGNFSDVKWMLDRCILAPLNSVVDEINSKIAKLAPGDECQCLSADEVVDNDNVIAIPIEFLNTLKLSGFPVHNLHLKPGMPLLLLRTLDAQAGLCNGSRLILQRVINRRILEVKIPKTNQLALIPRIKLRSQDDTFPFAWQRLQFPVAPAFAMTINKSQGQTIPHVGVHLLEPVFTHGQL